MKRLLLALITCLILIARPCYANYGGESFYDKIFNNLPIIDVSYENNQDPLEDAEYNIYFIKSPYPLVRLSSVLSIRNKKIPPGYYLLTPRTQNGLSFVLFKENGKIFAMVPVYEKQKIDPLKVYPPPPPPPKPKHPILGFPVRAVKAVSGKIFDKTIGKHEKPPVPPKYMLKTETVDGGKYFLMDLYFEDNLYRMLLKVES